MLWENILRRLNAVKCLAQHVRTITGLSTREKSSYHRSILIILSSIVEGLLYEIVKKNTVAPDHVFSSSVEYGEVCNIKSAVLGTTSDVHLYRRKNVDMTINDEGATFARFNLFLKHKKLINTRQYQTLEWVRKERNRLHIQGLVESDIDYTDAKVNRVSKAIKFLLDKA